MWLVMQWIKLEAMFRTWFQDPPRGVVVFADMQDPDRVLSWMCAQREIPCATMQHGIYAEYREADTVNQNNYQPRYVTDFLAWGRATASLVQTYAPNVHVSICGKPTLKPPPVKGDGEVTYDCVVIMDQNLFSEQNREMLALVREIFETDRELGVRMHPQNNPDEYDLQGFNMTTDQDWINTGCFVGHTTTFLLELLRGGHRLYRYESGAETAFSDPRIEFHTSDELRQLLHHPPPPPATVVNNYIHISGRDSVKAHVDAIHIMADTAPSLP
jgi:hypothetical protein